MNIGMGIGILAGLLILLWGAVVGVGLLAMSEMISLLFDITRHVRPDETKTESYPVLRVIRVLFKVLAILVLVATLLGFVGVIIMVGAQRDTGRKLEDLQEQMEGLSKRPQGSQAPFRP